MLLERLSSPLSLPSTAGVASVDVLCQFDGDMMTICQSVDYSMLAVASRTAQQVRIQSARDGSRFTTEPPGGTSICIA